jgi:diadenosine tetraphosphate (Ap4A) HIT family hydrolase
MDFVLDERLRRDCFELGRFELCRLLLMNDARFPWFILVPERAGVREIHELDAGDRAQLLRESCELGEALGRAFGSHKLNVAALGNVVAQLHVHHVVRFRDDPAWPRPVWCEGQAVPYASGQAERTAERLKAVLPALRA